MTNRDIVWHEASITKEEYQQKNKHKSSILWLTGLSGSGKSTIANAATRELFEQGYQVIVLDGDNIRHGLNKDLGFSDDDRKENIRRIGEVAKLFVQQGTIVITAFISPFREDRDQVRELVAEGEFNEIYVKCDLDICEKRDPKGLYKKQEMVKFRSLRGSTHRMKSRKRLSSYLIQANVNAKNAPEDWLTL